MANDPIGPRASVVSRRALFTGGGALVVHFSFSPVAAQTPEPQPLAPPPATPPPLPGSLKNSPMLDSWLKIAADGKVTVFTGKCELGQGARTALTQVAAEQLGIGVDDVHLITSDTSLTPNEGYTSGSQTMSDSGIAIQHATAQAREILLQLASVKLGTAQDALEAKNGSIVARDGRSLRFGELVADQAFSVRAAQTSKLKPKSTYTVMGQSIARLDIPGKVTGEPSYVHDLRPPGMLHARVVRPPSPAAKLISCDVQRVESLAGVRKVIIDGNFLAVVAEGEFRAIKAMEALGAAAVWSESATLPQPLQAIATLKSLPSKVFKIRDDSGPSAELAKTLEAEFTRAYMMHGAIGPSCALAQFSDGQMVVHSHGQGMFPLRDAIAELLHLPKDKVRCIHAEGSGCYGHNGADDAAADAALIAFAMPGVPIRLQWMREQEHTWEPYGPAMATKVKASTDAEGRITHWNYDVWTNTHSMRPGGAGATLAGQLKSQPFAIPQPQIIPQPAGGGDRNIIPLYKIPNLQLNHNFIPEMPLRVSAMRGLGAYANVFSIESFIDELAIAAGLDPVAFRLKNLEDQHARDVITLVAEKFGWQPNAKLARDRGQGFAFAKYKNIAGYCAVAIELEVARETGRIRLIRAVAAAEAGEAVNPDGIKNQIAGGIVQSASWTLHEAVQFDTTRILSKDWSTYPILRFAEVFDSLDVHVIDRPGEPFHGIGEASQGPTAAAIGNAIFNATGQRLRDLPLTATRIKQAIGV